MECVRDAASDYMTSSAEICITIEYHRALHLVLHGATELGLNPTRCKCTGVVRNKATVAPQPL